MDLNFSAADLFKQCKDKNNFTKLFQLRALADECAKLYKEHVKQLSSMPVLEKFAQEFPDKSVIAGSAALHMYQESIGQNPTWEPNDIDVWIPVKGMTPLLCALYKQKEKLDEKILDKLIKNQVILEYRKLSHEIGTFFKNHQYTHVKSCMQKIDSEYLIDTILSIHTFHHYGSSDQNVQVIYLTEMDKSKVVDSFDIDCAKVAYDLTTKKFLVEPSVAAIIKDNRLHRYENKNPNAFPEMTDRLRLRMQKYSERGFNF